ncbi:unnamed protein product [Amoebophrya sp. A120]|nr:unnamed protein product [Amoebophrya sp. A120]|eukprot:GSA120T00003670001.1
MQEIRKKIVRVATMGTLTFVSTDEVPGKWVKSGVVAAITKDNTKTSKETSTQEKHDSQPTVSKKAKAKAKSKAVSASAIDSETAGTGKGKQKQGAASLPPRTDTNLLCCSEEDVLSWLFFRSKLSDHLEGQVPDELKGSLYHAETVAQTVSPAVHELIAKRKGELLTLFAKTYWSELPKNVELEWTNYDPASDEKVTEMLQENFPLPCFPVRGAPGSYADTPAGKLPRMHMRCEQDTNLHRCSTPAELVKNYVKNDINYEIKKGNVVRISEISADMQWARGWNTRLWMRIRTGAKEHFRLEDKDEGKRVDKHKARMLKKSTFVVGGTTNKAGQQNAAKTQDSDDEPEDEGAVDAEVLEKSCFKFNTTSIIVKKPDAAAAAAKKGGNYKAAPGAGAKKQVRKKNAKKNNDKQVDKVGTIIRILKRNHANWASPPVFDVAQKQFYALSPWYHAKFVVDDGDAEDDEYLDPEDLLEITEAAAGSTAAGILAASTEDDSSAEDRKLLAKIQDEKLFGEQAAAVSLDSLQKKTVRRYCHLQVNILSGEFLVNGKPCQRLPRSIYDHPIYERLFGTAMFAVQPTKDGLGYKTTVPVNGANFYFRPPISAGNSQDARRDDDDSDSDYDSFDDSSYYSGSFSDSTPRGGGYRNYGEYTDSSEEERMQRAYLRKRGRGDGMSDSDSSGDSEEKSSSEDEISSEEDQLAVQQKWDALKIHRVQYRRYPWQDEEKGFSCYFKPFMQTPLIIEERDGVRAKLIPHKVFYRNIEKNKVAEPKKEMDVPFKLIDDYSHWCVISKTTTLRGSPATSSALPRSALNTPVAAAASSRLMPSAIQPPLPKISSQQGTSSFAPTLPTIGSQFALAEHETASVDLALLNAKSTPAALFKTKSTPGTPSALTATSGQAKFLRKNSDDGADSRRSRFVRNKAATAPVDGQVFGVAVAKTAPKSLIRAKEAFSGGVVVDEVEEFSEIEEQVEEGPNAPVDQDTSGQLPDTPEPRLSRASSKDGSKHHRSLMIKKTAKFFFRPKTYDHRDFAKGCLNSAAFVLDWHSRKVTDLRSGCALVDICSGSFAEIYRNGGFKRLSPWPYVHLWAEPSADELQVQLEELALNESIPSFISSTSVALSSARAGSDGQGKQQQAGVLLNTGGVVPATSSGDMEAAARSLRAELRESARNKDGGGIEVQREDQQELNDSASSADGTDTNEQPLSKLTSAISVASVFESAAKSIGVFVQLPRLQNIRFDVVLSSKSKVGGVQFHSREFAGWKVATANQNLGTLCTLKHGLLLDAVDAESQRREILLMPHGPLKDAPAYRPPASLAESLRKEEQTAWSKDRSKRFEKMLSFVKERSQKLNPPPKKGKPGKGKGASSSSGSEEEEDAGAEKNTDLADEDTKGPSGGEEKKEKKEKKSSTPARGTEEAEEGARVSELRESELAKLQDGDERGSEGKKSGRKQKKKKKKVKLTETEWLELQRVKKRAREEQEFLLAEAAVHEFAGAWCSPAGVEVDLENLRQPPLFRYTVKRELQTLHAQKERVAWLFLAHLHARTSGLYADPFLGRTGTGMALDLLRCGQVRGNLLPVLDAKKIDHDALDLEAATLLELGRISVRRRLETQPNDKISMGFLPLQHEESEVATAVRCLPALARPPSFGFLASLRLREMGDQLESVGRGNQFFANPERLREKHHFADNANYNDFVNTKTIILTPATYDPDRYANVIQREHGDEEGEDRTLIGGLLGERIGQLPYRNYRRVEALLPEDVRLTNEEKDDAFFVWRNQQPSTLVFCPEGQQLQSFSIPSNDDDAEEMKCARCETNVREGHDEYWKARIQAWVERKKQSKLARKLAAAARSGKKELAGRKKSKGRHYTRERRRNRVTRSWVYEATGVESRHFVNSSDDEDMISSSDEENEKNARAQIPFFISLMHCKVCEKANDVGYYVCRKCYEAEHAANVAKGEDPDIYRVPKGGWHHRHELLALKEAGLVCQPCFTKKPREGRRMVALRSAESSIKPVTGAGKNSNGAVVDTASTKSGSSSGTTSVSETRIIAEELETMQTGTSSSSIVMTLENSTQAKMQYELLDATRKVLSNMSAPPNPFGFGGGFGFGGFGDRSKIGGPANIKGKGKKGQGKSASSNDQKKGKKKKKDKANPYGIENFQFEEDIDPTVNAMQEANDEARRKEEQAHGFLLQLQRHNVATFPGGSCDFLLAHLRGKYQQHGASGVCSSVKNLFFSSAISGKLTGVDNFLAGGLGLLFGKECIPPRSADKNPLSGRDSLVPPGEDPCPSDLFGGWVSALAVTYNEEGAMVDLPLYDIWLNMYELARVHCCPRSRWAEWYHHHESQAGFGYLITYLAALQSIPMKKARNNVNATGDEVISKAAPAAVQMCATDYLMQLLVVAQNSSFFSDLEAPEIPRYHAPGDGAAEFHDGPVLQTIVNFVDDIRVWRPPRVDLVNSSADQLKTTFQAMHTGAASNLFGNWNDLNTVGAEISCPSNRTKLKDEKFMSINFTGRRKSSGAPSTLTPFLALPPGRFGPHASDDVAREGMRAILGSIDGQNRQSKAHTVFSKSDQYLTDRGMTLNALLGYAKECWDNEKSLRPDMCGKHVYGNIIPKHNHRVLCQAINSVFFTWRQNQKLHDFIKAFTERMAQFLGVQKGNSKDMLAWASKDKPDDFSRANGGSSTTSKADDDGIRRKVYVSGSEACYVEGYGAEKAVTEQQLVASLSGTTVEEEQPVPENLDLWTRGGFPGAIGIDSALSHFNEYEKNWRERFELQDRFKLKLDEAAANSVEKFAENNQKQVQGANVLTEELPLTLPQDESYAEISGMLMNQLQSSWAMTFSSSKATSSIPLKLYKDVHFRHVLRLQLLAYQEKAKETVDQLWLKLRSHAASGTENKIGLLPAARMDADNTPYKVLTRFFRQQITRITSTGAAARATTTPEQHAVENNEQFNTVFSKLAGSFAIALRHLQRARRCLEFFFQEEKGELLLKAELENGPDNAGWNAKDYPEFLAYEIDADISIWESQAEVALAILSEAEGNRLLQLIMGGGKTAVIAPLVLCAAARGEKLVRATVLSSLYATNSADWQWKIGGLLNRQVFPMICTRDMPLDEKRANKMVNRLREIRAHGHVIVTVPEHRLSLENKAIELATPSVANVAEEEDEENGKPSRPPVGKNTTNKGPNKSKDGNSSKTSVPDPLKVAASAKLHEALAFTQKYGRDVLDESDEILSPKYQLIYTIGDRRDMDGGQLRWTALAAAMRSVANHAFKWREKYGSEAVEVNTDETLFFPGFRLLESEKATDVFEDIRSQVVQDILHDQKDLIFQRIRPQLLPVERKIWRSAVLERGPTRGAAIMPTAAGKRGDLWPWEQLNETMRALALVLRGILSHEVLQVVLQKRWRVDFGAHPGRENYQMAVPFRAKDVASDRTEFGHPDIAVLLTISHYYQSGLNQSQLRDVFHTLEQRITESEAKALYREWAESCPAREKYLQRGLMKLEAVNLADVEMFEQNLFPAFAKHMDVINFWLFKMILPKQAKQFPQKVVATPWDLSRAPEKITMQEDNVAGEKKESAKAGTSSSNDVRPPGFINRAVTTGFSGTDDLQHVLPLTIKQKNLPSLEMTNGIQLRNLLRPENDYYHWLREDNTAVEILDILQSSAVSAREAGLPEEKINVVLDPGAMVLQLSNLEFSKEWLKRRPDMEACVFFDEKNTIRVIDRDHLDEDPVSFALSPYAEDMRKCLLYLDDVHTRGSDFRLPLYTRALLTLGRGMTKDKFLQACMRMRQIGKGQKICFVASKEVHRALQRHEAATEREAGGAMGSTGGKLDSAAGKKYYPLATQVFLDDLPDTAWPTLLRLKKTVSGASSGGKSPSSSSAGARPPRVAGAPATSSVVLTELQYVSTIISWTLVNTRKRICDLIPYFSAQGRQNINKEETYRMFYSDLHGANSVSVDADKEDQDSATAATSSTSKEQQISENKQTEKQAKDKSKDHQPSSTHPEKIDLLQVAQQCVEDEVLDLGEMYGHARQLASLPTVVSEQLKTLTFKLRKLKLAVARKAIAEEEERKKKAEKEASQETTNESGEEAEVDSEGTSSEKSAPQGERDNENDENQNKNKDAASADVVKEELSKEEKPAGTTTAPTAGTETTNKGEKNKLDKKVESKAKPAEPTEEEKAAALLEMETNMVKRIDTEIANMSMLKRIEAHVATIAPNVERFGSLFDEEQERELEQELEEERQVERPGPATAQRAQLSDALTKFVKTDGEVTGGLLTLGEALRDAPAYYKAIAGQFENLALAEEYQGADGERLPEEILRSIAVENVYVTEDFVRTIRGKHNADAHLKHPGWLFVSDLQKGQQNNANTKAGSSSADASLLSKVFLLISNFEAERCACLVSSQINFPSIDDHKLDDGTEIVDAYNRKENPEDGSGREFNRLRFCPRLYQFAAIVRLHQPEPFLRRTSYELHAPVALHVFAGSIHADRVLLGKVKNYLALVPRPNEEEDGAEIVALWDLMFEEENLIERDGFVRPAHRLAVSKRLTSLVLSSASAASAVPKASGPSSTTGSQTTSATSFSSKRPDMDNILKICLSPFSGSSPVRFLKSFYNNARHLDDELAMSSIGRLLGAAELGGQASNEDILMLEGQGETVEEQKGE